MIKQKFAVVDNSVFFERADNHYFLYLEDDTVYVLTNRVDKSHGTKVINRIKEFSFNINIYIRSLNIKHISKYPLKLFGDDTDDFLLDISISDFKTLPVWLKDKILLKKLEE